MSEKPIAEKATGSDSLPPSDPNHPSNDPNRTASIVSAGSRRARGSVAVSARRNVNAKLSNPLSGFTIDELRAEGRAYAKKHGIVDDEDLRAFELGAILAQQPEKYKRLSGDANEDEMTVLRNEYESKWSQPFILYLVIVLCSTCAAVQGMVSSFWEFRVM
jgi:hypothetical protein